jgi:SAM-dependent methyltransferase
MHRSNCWVCGSEDLSVFFEVRDLPVHCNVLWPSAAQARGAPRGDIRLAVCRSCGMIGNVAFTDTAVQYDAAYENSLHFSKEFDRYATALADDLVDRHDLRGKTVLEIGCGKGDFLRLLCAGGRCHGIGVDASYMPTAETTAPHLEFIRAAFNASEPAVPADMVVCRHVLEHIPESRAFAQEISRAARRRDGCVVFIEVPNVLYTLRDLGIWDVIYEHCLYFSELPLARLFAGTKLDVRSVRPAFGDQYLCLEARSNGAAHPVSGDPASVIALTEPFAMHYDRKVRYWIERLGQWRAAGERVAVWGSGSKGVTFLNTVARETGVDFVVDINPRKQGRFVAGTGSRIVPPEALRDAPPDHVLLMNERYQGEVRNLLAGLGVASPIETV